MTTATHKSESRNKLAWIEARIAEGRTVYIRNALKGAKITPANFAKWEASGHDLFKIDGEGRLRMARGRSYEIIDLCHLSAV